MVKPPVRSSTGLQENGGIISMKVIRGKNYISFFKETTGEYLRTGILKDGVDTGGDPFMADFPELLDVGIMGHCLHGKSGLCLRAGVECYQNGLTSSAGNMTVEDFELIVKECRGKTYQIALGGCGDPDQHEDFEKILKLCRENDIVPNFTTSGLGLTDELAGLCKKYCGAVAVSWYRSEYTTKAIQCLTDKGVKTNIHYVLNTDTVREAVDRLHASISHDGDGFPENINAVIFLLHKPVGQGSHEKMIRPGDNTFWELIHFIASKESDGLPFKIGFDSCTVPALMGLSSVDEVSVDTCEGARWSAYISPDMRMIPCSFAHDRPEWSVDLREHTISEAWNSDAFERFRQVFRVTCPDCKHRGICMGGCPVVPEIVLCEERSKP